MRSSPRAMPCSSATSSAISKIRDRRVAGIASREASGAARTPLYEAVADRITRLIDQGTLRPGDRVPSVRQLSRQLQVSITTVLEAYRLLEDHGALEARPQSGHYVRARFPPP